MALFGPALIVSIFEQRDLLSVVTEAFWGAGPGVGEGAALVSDDVEWEERIELDEVEVFADGVADGDERAGGAEFCGLERVEGECLTDALTLFEGEDDGFEGDGIFVEGVGGMRGIEVVEEGVFGGGAAADPDEGE